MYCPDCGEDPWIWKEEHPNSYYSDPLDEHEFQGDVVRDYDDYDGPRGRLYPDSDDEEIFF